MTKDFDILIGVDMTNAESEIKNSLDSIANSYPMKIKSVFENKDAVVKEIAQITKLIENVGKLDSSINIEADIKKAIDSANKLKKSLEDGMKSSKKSTADNNVELEKGNTLLKTQIKLLKDAQGNEKRIVKTTTGSSTDKTTKTSVNGKEQEGYDRTINNEKIKSDEKKLQTQLLKQKELFQKQLADIELKGLANKKSTQSMQNKINELNVKDVSDLKNTERQLKKIVDQYSIIEKQVKNKQLAIKKENALDSIVKDKSKIDPKVLGDNKRLANDLDKKTKGVSEAGDYESLRVAMKKVEKSYETLRAKQDEYIVAMKAEAQVAKKAFDEKSKYDKDYKEAQVKKNMQDGKELDKQTEAWHKNKEKQKQDEINLANQMANGREGASSKATNDTKKVDANQSQAINKELERTNMNQMEINKSTKLYEQLMKDIKKTGFIDDADFTKARRLMTGLSSDSKSLATELKAVKREIDAVQTKANKQIENQKHVNAAKIDNTTDVNKVKDKGIVPQSFIDNFKQLNSMLDFTSDAKDLKIVKEELSRILQLEKDIIAAGADNAKRKQAILNAEEKLVKSTNAHADAVQKVQHNIAKQITDATRRNNLEEQAMRIQSQINGYKDRGTALTHEESRTISQMKSALERELSTQKDIEKTLREEVNLRRTIASQVENATYKASRGLNSNPTEQRRINAMADNLKVQTTSLVNGNQTGESFTRSAQAVRDSMNAMNNEHRRVSDSMRDRSSSTLGLLGTAMKKIPVWMSAMSLFYGSINLVKSGFNSLLELDKAMINLAKVTEASGAELEKFKQTAYEIGDQMGVVSTEVIKATTEFQKLGYTLQESALLGKNTILYANVGDMGIAEAQKSIVSAVKGFNIEIDKSGSNVRKLVDIFNEVGNNYAITSEGIGEALRRSSAVLNEAGNSVEQSVALVTAANTTIQDPARVGTAIKTISMRLRGVSEEGENITKLVPNIQKSLDSLNLKLGLKDDDKMTLMEDENTFLTTYEMFDKISKQWDKLEDIERANLVELIGGKQQGSIVAAMIGNWSDATNSYETALNSAGSAQNEFNAHMDGFEYKIGRTKNALQAFWVMLIDDEAIKNAIDGLTRFIEVFTKFVDFPAVGGVTMITEITALILLFSSGTLKAAIIGAAQFTGVMAGMGKAFAGMGAIFMGVITKIPQVLAFMAVIYAVSKAFEFLFAIINAPKKARESEVNAIRNEITELQNLKRAYEDIDKEYATDTASGFENYRNLEGKGKNRNDEEDTQFKAMKKTIEENLPNSILYFNEYGDAVLRSAESMAELRKETDALELAQSKKLLKADLEDADFKDVKKSIDKTKGLVSEQDDYIKMDEIISETEKWLEKELKGLDEGSAKYYLKIEEVKEKSKNLINNSNLSFTSKQMTTDLLNSSEMFNGNDKMFAYLDGTSKTLKSRVKTLVDNIKDSKLEISMNADGFYDLLSTAMHNTVGDFKIDSSEGQIANSLGEYIKENLYTFDKEFLENIDVEFEAMFNNAIKGLEVKGFEVELFKIDENADADEVAKEISEIQKVLSQELEMKGVSKESKVNTTAMISILDDLKAKYLEVSEVMNNERLQPISFEQDVVPLVSDFESAISGLDSAYRSLADGQEMSVTQVFSLIKEYPELSKHLESHNGQLKISGKAILELAKIKETEFKKDLQIKKAQAESARAKAEIVIRAIMSEAKAEKLLTSVKEKGANATISSLKSEAAMLMAKGNLVGGALKLAEANSIKAYSSNMSEIDALEKLLNADYTGNLGSLSNNKEEKKSDKESIYITDEYRLAIEKLNHEIAKLQKIKSSFPEHSKKYQDAIKKEIKLQKEVLSLTNKQAQSVAKQIKSGAISQTGSISSKDESTAKLSGWGGQVNSKYGMRTHPIYGVRKSHDGIDIAGSKGDRLDANVSGKVVFAGSKGNGLGKYVQIQSNDGMKHLYAHLDKVVVKLGQTITAGMQVGNIGASGAATGPHLHYETRNASGKLVDPTSSYNKAKSGKVGGSTSASSGVSNVDSTQQAIDKAKSDLLSLQMDAITTQENIENLEVALVNAGLAGFENKKLMNDNQLANSENRLLRLTESSKEYRKELDAQRGILERKQKHNNQEISYLKGMIGSGTLSAIAVDEFTQRLHELGLEKNALNFEQEELTMRKIQSTMSSFSNSLNDDIAYAEYSMGLYHQSSKEYVKAAKVKEGHLITQLKLQENELAFLEKEKKTNKSLTSQQIKDINELIRERKVAVLGMLEGIRAVREEMLASAPAMYQSQRESLSDDIAYTDYAMKLYDSASEGFRKFATSKQGLLETQLNLHKEELNYLEQEKKMNKNLNSAQIFELNNLIRESRKAVYSASEAIIALKTQIADSKLSAELFTMASETEKYARKIREINDKMKHDANNSDKEQYAKEIESLRQVLALRKGEVADIKNNISRLKNMKDENKDNLEMVKKITEEIARWEDKLVDSEGAILDVQKSIKDAYKKIADTIVDIYKEQLNLMKKADEDHYKKKMDAERKAHESRISQIDKEMSAVQKAYDLQNQKLDREKSTEGYSKELTKLQDEAKELQKQIAILSLDDSYEAKAKKAQLVKQLTETEMKIAEHQNDRTYELRKNNLDDDLKTDLEMLESKKNAFQAEYDAWVEMQEKIHEEQMKIFEQQLNDERKFAQLREEIMKGNFDAMAEMLGQWSGNVEGQMSELGEVITHNFTDKIADAIKALTDLKNMNIGSFDNTTNGSGSTNLDGDNVYEGSQGGAVEDLADINGSKPDGGVSGENGETSSDSGTNPKPPSSGNGGSGSSGGGTTTPVARPYKIVKVTETYWLFNSTKMATSTRIKELKEGQQYKYYLVEKDGMWDLGGGWFPKKYLRLISTTETVKPVVDKKPASGGSSSSSNGTSSARTYTGQYADIINSASKQYGVDPFLIASVIKQESGFNASAKSGAGASGLMQLMPGTAKELGVKNVFDPKDNIMGGTKYLAEQLKRFSGDMEKALYAYNAGAGNVNSIINSSSGQWKEPKNYYDKVSSNYQNYTGGSYGNSSSGSSSSSSGKMKTTENLNLRSKPNTNGEILATISKGSVIEYNGMEAGWAKVTANGKNGYASRQYLQSFDTGGFTGAWGKEGRMALLHQKELVLNEEQTRDILNTAKIVEKIKAMFPSIGGSINPPRQATTERESVINEYNIEVIVENLNGGKKDAERVADQIVNAIKRNKGGRF